MSCFCSKLCGRLSSQNKPHRFIETVSSSLQLWPVLPPFCASHSPVILWLFNRSFIMSQVQLHFCTFASAIPSAWKAFNLRYMHNLLIPCIQASAEICCMSILQCYLPVLFLLFPFYDIWTIFGFIPLQATHVFEYTGKPSSAIKVCTVCYIVKLLSHDIRNVQIMSSNASLYSHQQWINVSRIQTYDQNQSCPVQFLTFFLII